MQFSNKPLAVVTAASSGLGLELARQFARHGFDMLICAEDAGIKAAAPAVKSSGSLVEALQADLATYEGVETLCARIAALGRPVDSVALNAASGTRAERPRVTSVEDELRVIARNVTSTVHLARRVVADMVARGSGRLLFVAPHTGAPPSPLETACVASRAFVLSFAEALRNELKATGVTITALVPGKGDMAAAAKHGFEAMMAGKERVVGASMITKLQGAVTRFVPEDGKPRDRGAERRH